MPKRKHTSTADSEAVASEACVKDDQADRGGGASAKKRKLSSATDSAAQFTPFADNLGNDFSCGDWYTGDLDLGALWNACFGGYAPQNAPEPSEPVNKPMAPIEKLPIEILQQILGQLNSRSFFCAKMSSPWLFVASKDSHGKDLVNNKALRRHTKGQFIAQVEARLNASRPGWIPEQLTCSGCCRLCRNDRTGFSDCQFLPNDPLRKCIKCLHEKRKVPIWLRIKGSAMFCCDTCGIVDSVQNGMKAQDTNAFLSSIWLPVSPSYHYATAEDWITDRRTTFTPICKKCRITGRAEAERAAKEAKGKIRDVIKEVYRKHKTLGCVMGFARW